MLPLNKLKQMSKWAFFISIGIALLPLALAAVGIALANIAGCEINEAVVEVCNLGGIDIGGMLYFMLFSAWFSLVTVPIGGSIAILSLIVYATTRLVTRDQKAPRQTDVKPIG